MNAVETVNEGINWTLAGAVTLSGVAIVFAALIILILSVMVMGKVLGSTAKPKPATAVPVPAVQAPAAATPAAAPIIAAPVPVAPVVQDGIEEDAIAAISGAVACIMTENAPGTSWEIASISRAAQPVANSRLSRPVWGFAGMQQNTRPF